MTEVQIRKMIRAFLLTATREELEKELAISREKGNKMREKVILEMIADMED